MEALVRLNYFAAGSCERGKYRGGRVERALTNDCGQLGLSAGRCQGTVKFGNPRKRKVDGLLGREEAFGHFHGGIPACFEHDISPFARRSPAAMNSVL
jgi:hypothetical protein